MVIFHSYVSLPKGIFQVGNDCRLHPNQPVVLIQCTENTFMKWAYTPQVKYGKMVICHSKLLVYQSIATMVTCKKAMLVQLPRLSLDPAIPYRPPSRPPLGRLDIATQSGTPSWGHGVSHVSSVDNNNVKYPCIALVILGCKPLTN